jgi:hypothetical protein
MQYIPIFRIYQGAARALGKNYLTVSLKSLSSVTRKARAARRAFDEQAMASSATAADAPTPK